MPPRKKKRTYRKKRPYKKRRYPRKNMLISVDRTPVPKTAMIKFRYVDDVTIDPAIGGVATHVFSCNGMYDPNITGTGHQPHGFDQWMTFYNHFTVVGAKITATAMTDTEANANQYWFGVAVRPGTTLVTNSTLAREDGMMKWRYNSGKQAKTTVSRKFSTKKFFGVKTPIAEHDYRGSNSANPNEQAYFHVTAGAIGTNDPYAVECQVVIEYIAVLTEPKPVGQS